MRVRRGRAWKGAVAAGVAAGCLALLAGCRPAPPRLEVTPTHQDLGTLTAGDQGRVTFTMRNPGGQRLKIESVQGNCGCVVPSYPKSLAPGASGEILVRLESEANWRGKIERELHVRSNDPQRPDQKLTLGVNIDPLLTVTPEHTVVEYSPGEVILRDITLKPKPGSDVEIRDVVSESALVQAKVVPVAGEKGARNYRLQLDIGPCPGPGDSTVAVRVRTNHVGMGEIAIPVNLRARTGVVTEPTEIVVPSVPAQPDGRELGSVRVFTRSGRLRVLGVETGHPGVRASVREVKPNQAYDVKLQVAGLRPGPLDLQIRITTDDPRNPVVTVPLVATLT